MAKPNIFKQAKEKSTSRISDRDYFEEMEAKTGEARPAEKKPVRSRTASAKGLAEPLEKSLEQPLAGPGEGPKRKPGRPAKAQTAANMRTTLNMSEEDFCLMNDLVYTIRSSGQSHFMEVGDFRMTKKDFWGLALKSMKKDVKRLYGEVKTSPETKNIKS